MNKKILILGATGMLGHDLFQQLRKRDGLDVYGTVRQVLGLEMWISEELHTRVRTGVDANDFNTVTHVITNVKPDVVVNCVAVVGKLGILKDPLSAININARFPLQLALICRDLGARLIHIGSDGVFDGKKGMYTERDAVNISDFYGMTKFLSEVGGPNCVTLRTSIIGHELRGKNGLVEWFLSQNGKVRGYSKVIYSGFPTVELARIICDYILPNPGFSGVYHVSSDPISKFDLLRLIAARYGRQMDIEPSGDLIMDRSLDSSLFRSLTGYKPPPWVELVDRMYTEHEKYKKTSVNTSGDHDEKLR